MSGRIGRYIVFPTAGREGGDTWLRIARGLAEHGLRPGVWLGASTLEARAAAEFPDCHIVVGKRLRSRDPRVVVGELARLPGALRCTPDPVDRIPPLVIESIRTRAAAMLARTAAWPEADRAASRSALVSAILRSVWAHLAHHRPDVVVSAETPFSAPTFILWELAGLLDIPRIAFENVKQSPLVMVRTSIAGDPIPTRTWSTSAAPSTPAAEQCFGEVVAEVCDEFLAADDSSPRYVRDRVATAARYRRRDDRRKDGSSVRAILRGLRAAATSLGGMRQRSPRTVAATVVSSVARSRARAREARDEWASHSQLTQMWAALERPDPAARGMVLFALGYEPEKNVLPDGGNSWDQIDVALRLRMALPEDVELVVREHPTQFFPSMRGHRGRTPTQYRVLAETPGVRLDASGTLSDVLGRSRLCASVKGSASLWALANGTPGLVLGNPWFSSLPGIRRFRSSEDVTAALDERVPPAAESAAAIRRRLEEITFLGNNNPGFDQRYRDWSAERDLIRDSMVTNAVAVVLSAAGGSRD